MPARITRNPLLGAAVALVALALVPMGLRGQDPAHCAQAHAYLEDQVDMAAITEPDTIDDWRTGGMVPGCRVTAAGVTSMPERDLVVAVYEGLRSEGWTRTPDPADAPNEASLRFRKDGSDCLFNYYTDGMLFTEAEEEVDNAIVPLPGQHRFNFLVMCMPAMPAG